VRKKSALEFGGILGYLHGDGVLVLELPDFGCSVWDTLGGMHFLSFWERTIDAALFFYALLRLDM
jgi:hypothetical protein